MRATRTLLAILATLSTFLVAVAYQGTKPKDELAPLPVVASKSARWYKGNLHTHSFWSDGDDFPEMIADWYKRHDYQFLGLTDHNVLSEGERWAAISDKMVKSGALKKYKARFGDHWVQLRKAKVKEKDTEQVRLKPLDEFRSLLEEPGKFLLIPSEEITNSAKGKPVHVNGINLRDAIKLPNGATVPESILAAHRATAGQAKKSGRAMLTFLNHPNFQWGVTAEEMAGVEELRYFEVYNGHPGVRNDGDALHASCERMWDIVLALRLGKRKFGVVSGLATDDAHAYHAWGAGKTNPGRGWVMVKAPYLSAEAIVSAMDAGNFYSSTGVVLDDLRVSGEEIGLKIRPEKGVTYRTEFIATLKDADLTGKPRKSDDDETLPVTQEYSKDVGKVVATSTDANPSYKLTGKELYVRARIISDKAHPNPFKKGDVQMAWTQPAVPQK